MTTFEYGESVESNIHTHTHISVNTRTC